MKTRINLYVTQLRPVKEQLPLIQSLSIIAGVFLLTIVTCGGLYWLNYSESQQQEALRSTLAQEQGHLATQAAALSEINDNKQLMQQIARVKSQIKNKKRILAALERQAINPGGFTDLLLALAQVSDQKVWLTAIKSHQGALTLSGSAKKSQDIPKWVARLNKVPRLQGTTFSALSMERDDAVINFVLNNHVPAAE